MPEPGPEVRQVRDRFGCEWYRNDAGRLWTYDGYHGFDAWHVVLAARGPLVDVTPAPVLPAEPEPGAYLIGDQYAIRTSAGPRNWRLLFTDWWYPWPYLWEKLVGGPDVTITRLVPETSDRAQELPEVTLPWVHEDPDGDRIEVSLRSTDSTNVARVRVASGWDVYLDTHESRLQAAAAILAVDRAIMAAAGDGAS